MSSSFAKSKLKSAKEAISKKDWPTVRSLAEQIVEHEPENYTALVFLGLANLNTGNLNESEAAYRKATVVSADLPTAWQGLADFYTKQKAWSKLRDVFERQLKIYDQLEESTKLGEAIQRLIELTRAEGTRIQLIAALSYLRSSSPYYHTLSLLPPPTPSEPTSTTTQYVQTVLQDELCVLKEIVELTEKEDLQIRAKEVEKRRMRLGGGKPQTKSQVEEAVFAENAVESTLPELYQSMLNHPSLALEEYREIEQKLFSFHLALLYALPITSPYKAKERKEVKDLAKGAVLIESNDRDAWKVDLEWGDWETIDQYPTTHFKKYIDLFPDAHLTLFMRGYLKYFGLEDVPELEDNETGKDRKGRKNKSKKDAETDRTEEISTNPSGEDPFKLMFDGIDGSPQSLLCRRILSQIFLFERDYQSAITTSLEGLSVVASMERRIGIKFTQSRLAFQTILATSYVHFYAPKHHPTAEPLLDIVLETRPEDSLALIGKAYVLEARADWADAKVAFDKALATLDNGEGKMKEEAREEAAWCSFKLGEHKEGQVLLFKLETELGERKGEDERSLEQRARVLWKLGMCAWEMTPENRQTAHDLFVASLKHFPTYAPSFTSLGIYYSDIVSPSDTVRASRCFQHAFELDPRQGEAAKRLADNFADAKEWELVEIISKRVIEGEGGLEGGLENSGANKREREVKGRFLVENVWAWKALGAVALTRNAHAKAIENFQIALRSDPTDVSSWLQLSEAYAKSGKQAAALKTLSRASELEPDNWLVTFVTGDVYAQLGSHSESVQCFEKILTTRPEEVGVLIALAHSSIAIAIEEAMAGYHARAESSFIHALQTVQSILNAKQGFGAIAWKLLADACVHLSQLAFSFNTEQVKQTVLPFVETLAKEDQAGSASIDGVASPAHLLSASKVDASFILRLAACAYAYRHQLLVGDDRSSASASHDMAIALHHLGCSLPDSEEEVKKACVKRATFVIKAALRVRPKDEQLWVSLGTIVFETSSRLSQHAFIMALEINHKNPIVWSNLGFLYLKDGDTDLAAQAFLKSQTIDPDCSLAWMGQGILTLKAGRSADARPFFEHAAELSNDSLLEANLLFSKTTHDLFSAPIRPPSKSILAAPMFALQRYCEQRPKDATALHLLALISERLGDYEAASIQISKCVDVLESVYEESEDPTTERQFAIAQSNLGRLKLAVGDYTASIEAFSGTLGLVTPEDTEKEARRLRVHAKFGSGLAHYFQGELDESIDMFQSALDELQEDPMDRMKDQVSVMLARVLWSLGGTDEKEAAKETLLECVSSNSTNLEAVATLAAVATLSSDSALLDATLSEILGLPQDKKKALDPNDDLDWLLVRHHLGKNDLTTAQATLTRAAHLYPSSSQPLLALSKLHLQQRDSTRGSRLAKAAYATDGDVETGWEALHLRAIAGASEAAATIGDQSAEEAAKMSAKSDAQRAIMLRPWEASAWLGLDYVRAVLPEVSV
ncbi:TPR repeat-containing protein [Phaffia rhodozyma]|uniref:TPR repeat-containing protein n=1 Tax=Phaffia rhodozyma TaxID=264483 RepID=A0A0F7SR00_PHARH|nr:TPR repeat-containing protein [Phaffia rhodozyma]